MIRRFIGPILGIAGLATIGVGGIALLLRVSSDAHPVGDLETAVVIIPPNVVALEGLNEITITAPGSFLVRTARPADVYAWATEVETSVVRRLESWEEIEVDRVWSTTGILPEHTGDMWRGWERGSSEKMIEVSTIEPGLAVVIISGSTAPLGEVAFEMTRDRGNGWAWPVLAGGLGVLAIALVFLAVNLIEVRPEKKEILAPKSKRPEPKKSEPKKSEPKKSEPKKSEPKKSEPKKSASVIPKGKRRASKGKDA